MRNKICYETTEYNPAQLKKGDFIRLEGNEDSNEFKHKLPCAQRKKIAISFAKRQKSKAEFHKADGESIHDGVLILTATF